MPVSRKESRGGKAFTFPLLGIVILLTSYWILSDWQNVPNLINNALAAVHLLH